jgi:hypothetical protein
VIYLDQNTPTQFYRDGGMTLSQFEQLLLAENKNIGYGLRFYIDMGEGDIEIDNLGGTIEDYMLNSRLKIKHQGTILSYYVPLTHFCHRQKQKFSLNMTGTASMGRISRSSKTLESTKCQNPTLTLFQFSSNDSKSGLSTMNNKARR